MNQGPFQSHKTWDSWKQASLKGTEKKKKKGPQNNWLIIAVLLHIFIKSDIYIYNCERK